MGNSSSAPAHNEGRRANRLSKPLTDPSLNNLRVPEQQSEIAVHPKQLNSSELRIGAEAENATSETAHASHDGGQKRQSRRVSEPGKRKSTRDRTPERGVRSSFGSFIGGLPDRLSRSRSGLSQLSNAANPIAMGPSAADRSSVSFMPETGTADHESPLQSVYEDEDEDEGFHSQTIETSPGMPHPGDLPYDSPQFTSGRRKSLLTPGVATRTLSGQFRDSNQLGLREAHSPHSSGHRHSIKSTAWAQSQPSSPPFHNRAVSPLSRVSTPTQLEYSHLGGLKPGTLRITNGHPPPTPNDHTRRGLPSHLSSEPRSNESCHSPPSSSGRESYKTELYQLPCPVGEESGLGLHFFTQTVLSSRNADGSNHHLQLDKWKEAGSPKDEPGNDYSSMQPSQGRAGDFLDAPYSPHDEVADGYRSTFLDSPFSFESSPTFVTALEVDGFNNNSSENEGVATLEPRNDEYDNPDLDRRETDSGQDSISSLREKTTQPLKKADSGYSSATSAHSKRTNSGHRPVRLDTPEERDYFSDKIDGWSSVDNNDAYNEIDQRYFEAPLPDRDITPPRPSRAYSHQLETYHNSKSVSHLRQTENPVTSSIFSRKRSVEMDSNRIAFQNSFSSPHLPPPSHKIGPRHQETQQPPVPPIPLEMTARCGCVLRFYNLDDPHRICCPNKNELPSRHPSEPTQLPPRIINSRGPHTIVDTHKKCTCSPPVPSNSGQPTSHPPKPAKLSRRRRSSGIIEVASPPTNHNVDMRSRELSLHNVPTHEVKERRQSSEVPRMRRSLQPSPHLSRPKSFASLGGRSPSEYRDRASYSEEPSPWAETSSAFSDSSGLRRERQSPKPDQHFIPPVPPLPAEMRSKEEKRATSKTRASNREGQPRKLVKPQKGSSRHPRDSRVAVHGDF